MKGQKARGRGPHVRFEGGQTPISKRLPKVGRPKLIREFPVEINLGKVMYFV